MLRKNKWVVLMATMASVALQSCKRWEDYGQGGSESFLTLPFPSGQYWILTQTYNQGSHVDYGFEYGDDRYALDFTQSGCDAYGEAVTPLAEGIVMETATEGNGDHGYGNTVLIEHGDGYISRYGHLSEIWVSEGDYLDNTDPLGAAGNTGYSLGTACPQYPGTHLHVAFYKDGVAVKPEPISGNENLEEYCWYNREGAVNCDHNPGNYTPVDESAENSEDLDIDLMSLSPEYGTAGETPFVWVAVVDSPDEKPDATLVIHNPNDGEDYEFEMETESRESPFVFTHRKTLRDANTRYEYWVEVSNDSGKTSSPHEDIEVDESEGSVPELDDEDISPSSGEASETEFEWECRVESDDEPEVTLHIVSAQDAEIYRFTMDLDEDGNDWEAAYEKSLRDEAVYTWWITAENRDGITTSSVESVEVE
ncbi:MAG: M23 family metallopeptidase [Candidatus Gracilibacteria bacterium]|jgi:hypothetical protein